MAGCCEHGNGASRYGKVQGLLDNLGILFSFSGRTLELLIELSHKE
jgi:hypothetical protein